MHRHHHLLGCSHALKWLKPLEASQFCKKGHELCAFVHVHSYDVDDCLFGQKRRVAGEHERAFRAYAAPIGESRVSWHRTLEVLIAAGNILKIVRVREEPADY